MRQGFETAETHLRSAISKVISRRHVLNFGKNKIFQGNAADALFHTQTGRVKLSVRSSFREGGHSINVWCQRA